MSEILHIQEFLSKAREGIPVVDVRSPAEYEHAHIPGAVSIPLFDNDERASVGTVYKKQGKTKAVKKGLEFVGPKLADFADQALRLKSPELLVHCWRGGMRSASMAWLFETLSLKCFTLEGGYKAYRNHVLDFFRQKFNLTVVGGCTGAGKTDLLHRLREAGEQVLDLEELAHHKGSAFGAIGEAAQPSSEMYEHRIFDVLSSFDPRRTVWVEDESKNVGKVFIPDGLWEQIKYGKMIILDTDYEARLERIMKVYASYPVDELARSILKIERRLGSEKCRQAYVFCQNGNLREAARICLAYYDRLYLSQLETRKKECRVHASVPCQVYDVSQVCAKIISINESL